MQSIISEYLAKRLNILGLQDELQRLIKEYNKHTGRYLFVYASDITKGSIQGVVVSLVQDDFYTIQDLLRECKSPVIDVYLETPGGSGEAAEEIAKFLRRKFTGVNFVIVGEAKSAGTILALSGDNIYMTDTGSLGPIDAQVRIGRHMGSAHDYKEWIDNKREEARMNKSLNPVDALIISQISPLEIAGVINSLEFAKDLVKEWLEKYKFKNWTITESRKIPVTNEMRRSRANEIADKLCNHTFWRSHGRSLKINDLKEDLLIEAIDDDQILADILYRIKTVIRFIFDTSTIFKLYYSEDLRIAKNFTTSGGVQNPIQQSPNNSAKQTVKPPSKMTIPPNVKNAKIELKCPKCGKDHEIMGYFDVTSEEIKKEKLLINSNVQENDIFVCDNCKFVIDLKSIKNNLELQTNKKILFK